MRRAVVLAPIVAVMTIILFQFDPAVSCLFPPCPFHMITGFYCPGCGSLRATHALLHGHLAEAFAMNPLMVIFLFLLAVFSIRRSWCRRVWIPWCALAVLLVYGVLRNIDVRPFMLLAPR